MAASPNIQEPKAILKTGTYSKDVCNERAACNRDSNRWREPAARAKELTDTDRVSGRSFMLLAPWNDDLSCRHTPDVKWELSASGLIVFLVVACGGFHIKNGAAAIKPYRGKKKGALASPLVGKLQPL